MKGVETGRRAERGTIETLPSYDPLSMHARARAKIALQMHFVGTIQD